MQSNQISIKAIKSSNYRIVNKEEYKNKLVHEHHLITARIKQQIVLLSIALAAA
jgi:predicted nucleic acid-binding protein